MGVVEAPLLCGSVVQKEGEFVAQVDADGDSVKGRFPPDVLDQGIVTLRADAFSAVDVRPVGSIGHDRVGKVPGGLDADERGTDIPEVGVFFGVLKDMPDSIRLEVSLHPL